MLGLLLFALMFSSPLLGEPVVRAVDINSLQALVSAQAAAIQDLQARLSASENALNQQEATIRQLQDSVHTQGRTVGFSVDFGTKPYHNVVLTSTAPLLFNHVVSNVGGAYDAATGYFTPPYRGLYIFHLHFMGGFNDNVTDLSINVDNSIVAVAAAEGFNRDPADQGSCTAVVHMSGGERVGVHYAGGQPTFWGSPLTSFSGAMIHPD